MKRLLILLVAIGLAPALAADAWKEHPGYVDLDRFVALAGGDEALTLEVNITGALLTIVAKSDTDLGRLVRDVKGVRAVAVEIDDDTRGKRVREFVRRSERELTERGWSRLATVREDCEEVSVLTRDDGDLIAGVTVLVVDLCGGEAIFTNIAGFVDLELLLEFGGDKIPGLDRLEGMDR